MTNVDYADIGALKTALKNDRLRSYAQMRGGYSIPLAGATYWLILGVAGYSLDLSAWAQVAFFGSGAIFPLALMFSKLLNNPFMKSKSSVDSVLVPTFISMLLFWAYIPAAAKAAPDMVPLILAIGLSVHWPVIGWTYGRTPIYAGHAVLRAIGASWLWLNFPDQRLTLLSFFVAGIYLATVAVILVDSGMVRRRLQKEA